MYERSVIIPSSIESINRVEKIIDEISEQRDISQDLYGKILIATLEAVNNAISHGNNFAIDKKVKVEFRIIDNQFTISVEDEGKGFNLSVIPDPTAPENIEKISGRGIFIMRQYADELEFNDLGNRSVMTFAL